MATDKTDEKSIEDKVRAIIIEQLDANADEVVPDASFDEDLGADSLDLVELVMQMEDEFDEEEELVTWVDDRTVRLDPKINLEDLEEVLGVTFVGAAGVEDNETLGGLIYEAAGMYGSLLAASKDGMRVGLMRLRPSESGERRA